MQGQLSIILSQKPAAVFTLKVRITAWSPSDLCVAPFLQLYKYSGSRAVNHVKTCSRV